MRLGFVNAFFHITPTPWTYYDYVRMPSGSFSNKSLMVNYAVAYGLQPFSKELKAFTNEDI